MAVRQRARLIPISGIGTDQEAERRATSALLAVLSVVRDFSNTVLSPFGASKAQKAVVDCYTEVPFAVGGKTVRPDGLIQVTYGKNAWSALVEVKTSESALDADQVNTYWGIAREQGHDCVITISNEIPPVPGAHPTPGLKVKANSKVKVHHLSWTALLATAVMVKVHKGISDPEQAWILGELIRYLEYEGSGAMAFTDMGPYWIAIRDAARSGTLNKTSDEAADIATRWDQLVRFVALRLGAEIGNDVQQVLPKAQTDPKIRQAYVLGQLCQHRMLEGALRVPNTAGDIGIMVDLGSQLIGTSMAVIAPDDKGAVGRISWLVNQLDDADGRLLIESWPKHAKQPVLARLEQLREDKTGGLDAAKTDPARFRIVQHSAMGQARKTGTKKPGFIDSVLDAVEGFYQSVVQNLAPWRPKAPQMPRQSQESLSPPPDSHKEATELAQEMKTSPIPLPPVPSELLPPYMSGWHPHIE